MSRKVLSKKIQLSNIIPLFFLILIIFTFTTAYVGREAFFQYWDYAQYQDMTVAKAIYFRDLPLSQWFNAVKGIWLSTYRDYSDYHTILSIPFILFFGDSRLVYILSLLLLYFLPLILVLGKIATHLIPSHPQKVFWSTVYIALLTPSAWLPSLRGYPDVAASLFTSLAVLVYVQDFDLRKRWQFPLISLFLSLSILFRRHFVYSATAFFSTIILVFIWNLFEQKKAQRHHILKSALGPIARIVILGILTVLVLSVLGLPFIARVLLTNFGELYSSYEQPVKVSIEHYRGYYGWIAILLSMLGLVAGFFNRTLNRKTAAFIFLFFFISVLQWFSTVKQLGFHYSMHFTPTIILGISAFIWTFWETVNRKKLRAVGISIFVLFLSFNSFVALAPVNTLTRLGISPVLESTSLGRLFSVNSPPFERQDEEEMSNLATYLRSVAQPNDPVYVAAASAIISSDHLWHVDRALYVDAMNDIPQADNGPYIQQWIPFADSRDPYPLERLLYSKYVIVASPPQYHLRIEEHDVVRVVFDIFTQNLALAKDFKRLPEKFFLEGGVEIAVFERVRKSSLPTIIQTLRIMEEYTGSRPGGQLSWLSTSTLRGYRLDSTASKEYSIEYFNGSQPQPEDSSFIYLDTQTGDSVVSANIKLEQGCSGLYLALSAIDSLGKVMTQSQLDIAPTDKTHFSTKAFVPESKGNHIMLTINRKSNSDLENNCRWKIDNLSVQSDQ